MDFNHQYNNHQNENNGFGNNSPNNYPNGSPNQPYGSPYPPGRLQGRGFATASMVLGILAIVTVMILPIYLPCIFGSLAIVFALLSKGNAPKLSGTAVAGISCSAMGFAINIVLLGYSSYVLLSNPEIMMNTAKTYDEMIEQMYGVPTEDILGESMEDAVQDMMDTLFPSGE